jgi:hypothetical protein
MGGKPNCFGTIRFGHGTAAAGSAIPIHLTAITAGVVTVIRSGDSRRLLSTLKSFFRPRSHESTAATQHTEEMAGDGPLSGCFELNLVLIEFFTSHNSEDIN